MPRNASGTYTLPESAFVAGTVIRSSPVNSDLSDIASALTQSLATTGVSSMTGPIKAASGSVTAPSYAFASALGTGFYLSGANEFAWTANGVLQATFGATGTVTWVGGATFGGNVTVSGTFSTGATSFVAASDPILTLRNSTNDSAEHEILRLALGSGAGATASRRVVGTGANNITQIRDYIGTTEVLRLLTTEVSPKKNLSIDGGITVIATAGYVDLTEIAAPASPSANIARLYSKDSGGITLLAFKDAAGTENLIDAAGTLIAIIEDQKTSGTGGGTFNSGADRTRDLNTLVYNRNTLISLGSNQFTIPAGDWEIEWVAPAYQINTHQSFLYNVTDATEVARGSSSQVGNTTNAVSISYGSYRVSIAASKVFEIRHRCLTTGTFGQAASFGTEVYTRVTIRRA